MGQSTFDSFKDLIRASWAATKNERVRLFAFVTLSIFAYTLDLALPWAIGLALKVFVDNGFTEKAYHDGFLCISAYVGMRVLNGVCHHYSRYLQSTVAYWARMDVVRKIFEAVLRFPLRWHVNHHSGENLSRLHRSVSAVDMVIGSYIWQIMEGLIKFVFATTALFALDSLVALNVVGLGILTVGMMIFFNKRLVKNIRDNNTFYDKLNRTFVDYLFNMITVKTLKLEDAAITKLHEQQPKGLRISQIISKFQELKWGSVTLGSGLVLGSSLWIHLLNHKGFKGAFDVAEVYVIINYLEKIFQAIGSFTGYYGGLIESSTAYEDGHDMLEEAKRIKTEIPARRIPSNWDTININNLEFSYAQDEEPGIRGLRLDIKHGEKIALVGPSGGGKSTLLKILAGMIPPERCEISVDGVAGFNAEDIGHTCLLLPQEPEIFSGSVRYNLTMGQEFGPEQLQFFVSLCRVENVIAKLPLGWDSDLAEKGLNLSVGEKQRVAMARGLLRAGSKDLLLLDEPTSSLDPMTEKAIFYGLLYHFSDRTVVTACHRLALVPLFDKIVYIRQGHVEEMGSFKELLDKRGSFYNAWEDYERKVLRERPSSSPVEAKQQDAASN